MRTIIVALLLTAAVLPPPAAAQTGRQSVTAVDTCELRLRDGSRLYGRIERQDDAEIVFTTAAGATVTVKRADIVSIKQMKGVMIDGEIMPPDPNTSRLFFAPTGRSLPKGKSYVGMYEFTMPMLQFGVTDRFSLGGGTPLMFGLNEGERPFWVTPKLQVYDSPRTQIATGVLHMFNWDGEGAGVAYVVGTRGDETGAVTIGTGLAYTGDGDTGGVVMVGGERRLRRNLKFITENYVWKGGNGLATFGVRFIGERLSADLGLAIPVGMDEFFAFPMVNFVYVF